MLKFLLLISVLMSTVYAEEPLLTAKDKAAIQKAQSEIEMFIIGCKLKHGRLSKSTTLDGSEKHVTIKTQSFTCTTLK